MRILIFQGSFLAGSWFVQNMQFLSINNLGCQGASRPFIWVIKLNWSQHKKIYYRFHREGPLRFLCNQNLQPWLTNYQQKNKWHFFHTLKLSFFTDIVKAGVTANIFKVFSCYYVLIYTILWKFVKAKITVLIVFPKPSYIRIKIFRPSLCHAQGTPPDQRFW